MSEEINTWPEPKHDKFGGVKSCLAAENESFGYDVNTNTGPLFQL